MKTEQHVKTYEAAPNGGRAVCSCGYATPVVDESVRFGTGIKGKSVDDYFNEHLEAVSSQPSAVSQVETTMRAPAAEQAVSPAQRAANRKRR